LKSASDKAVMFHHKIQERLNRIKSGITKDIPRSEEIKKEDGEVVLLIDFLVPLTRFKPVRKLPSKRF